jgi:NTE family protein
METRPDILVLGGGGVAGIAWMAGVLAGIEDGSEVALSSCDYFVGTSAGSVVAAHLAGGSHLPRPGAADALSDADGEVPTPGTVRAAASSSAPAPAPTAFRDWALALGGPAASLGIRLATPAGALVRAGGLRLAPRGREPIAPLLGGSSSLFGALDAAGGTAGVVGAAVGAAWDGRLRVVAVARRSGRRVVFGSPGAPEATVDEAVRASCSVPSVFAPVTIKGVEYVDGGVWSPTSLDIAPARRDARVLCLCPTASLQGPLPLPMRAGSRAATLVEASTLARRGAHVQIVAPDGDSAQRMGRDLMASAGAAAILTAGYQQGLTL